MHTDEQKNASKTIGAKSKGPTTEVGKAKSAANANRHNLSGDRFMLLSTEDPIAYVEHIKYYVERFQPADPVERDLVDRLIAASWRDKRMDSMEASLFELKMEEQREDVLEQFEDLDETTRQNAVSPRHNRHAPSVEPAAPIPGRRASLLQRGHARSQRTARGPLQAAPGSSSRENSAQSSRVSR